MADARRTPLPPPWRRGLVAGLAGGVAWIALGALFFGPAQTVLADPDRQSAKLLAAFAGPPAPRISEAPWLLGVGALGTDTVQVAVGEHHTCARKTDGSLWCWGYNAHVQLGDGTTEGHPSPVQVEDLGTTVAEIAAGGNHTCARKTDGTLWCWGYNAVFQLGDHSPISRPSPVQVEDLGTRVLDGRRDAGPGVLGDGRGRHAASGCELRDGRRILAQPRP